MSEQLPARHAQQRGRAVPAAVAVPVTAVVAGALWAWVTLEVPEQNRVLAATPL